MGAMSPSPSPGSGFFAVRFCFGDDHRHPMWARQAVLLMSPVAAVRSDAEARLRGLGFEAATDGFDGQSPVARPMKRRRRRWLWRTLPLSGGLVPISQERQQPRHLQAEHPEGRLRP